MANLSNKEGAHTPAPWSIISYSNYFGFSISSPEGVCITERWYAHERSEQENETMRANARLIAAAPELLEALKGLVEARWMVSVDWAPHSDYDKIIESAIAVIGKAEGRS